ncbi:hypothetical protein JVT61DRAFT_9761 [Boletus reticuloceps]|uniref:Uncharacterized protein n=1 Tax=Boletus reticuloceps TaxID=495285 RepID=A0A8I2YGF0_9AGAM|nr:hypothetical protein JVT61DRAFT_9761 [Boletus reticuloceps]
MSSSPGENFFSGIAAQLGIAYYSISVGLTAMLTWVICYRMVTHGREVKKQLGAEYASVYAVRDCIFGVVWVGSGTSIVFACMYIFDDVYITADADTAGGIWTGMGRDSQGTAVDAQV